MKSNSKLTDLIGFRCGKLTAIKVDHSKDGTRFWKCRCDCGKYVVVSRASLHDGKIAACSKDCRFGDMIGSKFGLLTVVRRSDPPSGVSSHGRYWLCSCECGGSIIKPTRSLSIGSSCGCTLRLTDNLSAMNILIHRYKASSAKRGLEFSLTSDQCRILFKMSCHYCGCSPSQVSRINSSVFIYNGIDRKDNKHGYTSSNAVSCCKVCNQRKRADSYNQFLAWVTDVYLNRVIKSS